MKIYKRIKLENGFTLTELLVVIVIIGILAALTIPKFMNVTTRAKTTEAKLMLKQVYSLQRAYYLENDIYSENLEAIGFEHDKLKTDGGGARYLIELKEVDAMGFKATATAVIDFDKDGIFNVWEIDHEGLPRQIVAD
ncbi:prepilin-type N-terminal cleavage/methylation domain-containing protein [bacterium]|nr:prepilin-type N-terminal cleavage/methylation domain-containing protein [bacterium]